MFPLSSGSAVISGREDWRKDHGIRDLNKFIEALSEHTDTLSSDVEESLYCFDW